MNSYWEVRIVVDGFESDVENVEHFADLPQLIEGLKAEAAESRLLTQVYLLFHDHDTDYEQCDCIQFETSLKPEFEWNAE